MAKLTVGKGLDDYLSQLGNLSWKAPEVCGKAIYQGAKIVADQIHKEIEALPVASTKGGNQGRRDPTQAEKDGMLAGLGIAKKQNDNGYINVKIGMDGYNSDVTDKYPKGKANAMVARSIERGTTFMRKNSFISRAVRKTKAQAEAAMRAEVDRQITKIMK